MKKKLAAILAAGLLTLSLTACEGGDVTVVKRADIKVEPNGNTMTYVRYRNGYRMGDVEIIRNEDNTYIICITAIPPESFLSQ